MELMIIWRIALISIVSQVQSVNGSRRTPTLNSTVPQRTNIVEFPSPYAIVWICVRRMTEQNVVKNPSRNRQITPAL